VIEAAFNLKILVPNYGSASIMIKESTLATGVPNSGNSEMTGCARGDASV